MTSSLRCPGDTIRCRTLTIGSRSALVIAISRNYLLVYLCQAYGARRYGLDKPCEEISQAVRILSNSVYNVNTTARNFHGHVLILRHPSLGLKVMLIILCLFIQMSPELPRTWPGTMYPRWSLLGASLYPSPPSSVTPPPSSTTSWM